MKRAATILLFAIAFFAPAALFAQPGAPTLTLPSKNATKVSMSPDLVWNSASMVDSFQLQIATDTSFTTPLFDTIQGNINVYTAGGKLNNYVVYYWRVRGKDIIGFGDWSDTGVFRTIDKPAVAPNLLKPASNSKNGPVFPDFIWSSVTRASRYQMQLSTNSNFSTNKLDTIVVAGKQLIAYTKDTLSKDSVYFWRVRTENEVGWGDWSNSASFQVTFLPPAIPMQTMPANNAVNQTLNGILDWSTANNATRYRVILATDRNLTNILVRDSLLQKSYYQLPIENLLLDSSRDYYWTVAAGNDDEYYSRNSDTFKFSTINLLPPNRPTNISPATASVQHSRKPTFVWSDNSTFLPDSFYLHVSTFFVFTDTTLLAKTTAPNYTVPANAPLGGDTVYYWRVAGKNAAGFSPWSYFWNITTSVKNATKNPFLANMYPNPVSTTSTFEFELNAAQNVRVSVIDITGKEVLNVFEGQLNAQHHTLTFDASGLPNGSYFIAIAGSNALQALPFIKQ